MKKLILILISSAALAVYSQVVLDTQVQQTTHDRWLANVIIAFNYDGTISVRNEFIVRTLVDTNVISTVSLKSIILTGTNLESALSKAGLPPQTQLRELIRSVAQSAWTNSLSNTNEVQ